MPIDYDTVTKEWVAHDLGQEEIDMFIELGKRELMKMMALRMFEQFAQSENAMDVAALEAMPKENMGNA